MESEVFRMAATTSIRIGKEEKMALQCFADEKGVSLSQLLVSSALEKLEDAYDLELYKAAMTAYTNDPVTYTAEQMEAKYGIT